MREKSVCAPWRGKFMGLLVDIGNSRIKWCLRSRLSHGETYSAHCDDFEALQKQWAGMRKVESVWISSVAAAGLLARINSWVEREWKLTPNLATTRAEQLGVVNGYHQPAQLGVDRWMALIAARDLSNRALIVVDCGTATTIDAMDRDGRHLGGLILPGLRMMRESLLSNTAIKAPDTASVITSFAADTVSGIDSARLLSTLCLIRNAADALRESVADDIDCVLTGGEAGQIKDRLHMNSYHEPNLVLKGLSLLAGASE